MSRIGRTLLRSRKLGECIGRTDPKLALLFHIYLPFGIVGLYMLAFDDCSHCKTAFFEMFHFLPALLPSLAMGPLFDVPVRIEENPWLSSIATVVTLASVYGLSSLFAEPIRIWFGRIVVFPTFLAEALIIRGLIMM
jgi:hypothetical protein